MFETLTTRLTRALDGLRGRGRLADDDLRVALREVRMALLEADVALPVVKNFIERVQARSLGAEVARSLTPGQAVIGIVHRELVATLGEGAPFELRARAPAVVLLAGLQGAGKTTTAAKLARWITENRKREVMLATTDTRRPAAIAQLKKLADEAGVRFADRHEAAPILDAAVRHAIEVLVVDTAGRTTVDAGMMNEIASLHAAFAPEETLFVVDAMSGQDAARTARAFHERIPLTGVVLTKTDGDARGGAALSVRHVTGAPLAFLGTGERQHALEPFDPERVARRILGMGDVVGLVEQAEREAGSGAAGKLATRLTQGEGFTLADFREQLRQMDRLGGMEAILDKLPARLAGSTKGMPGGRELRRLGGIIDSMTSVERRHPEVIKASRKRRIAAGSGTTVQEVNRVLKQFGQTRTMMKRMGKGGGMRRMLQGMGLPRR